MNNKIIAVKSEEKWQATAIIGECLRHNSCGEKQIMSYKRESGISKAIKKAVMQKNGRGFSRIHCYILEDKIATLVRLSSDIKVVACLDEDVINEIVEGKSDPDVAAAQNVFGKHRESFDKLNDVEAFLKYRLGPNYSLMGQAKSASNIRRTIYQLYKEAEIAYVDALTKAVTPLI